jgi:8-oxo-dGTP pyrophosphatase MutT (NUDIX family)
MPAVAARLHAVRTHEIEVALRDLGLAPFWRDERVDLIDNTGCARGTIERATARILGLTTRSVNIVGWCGERLWLQQRALHKASDPGRWDVLASGLISAGESPRSAAVRETAEEAGVDLLALSHAPVRCDVLLVDRPEWQPRAGQAGEPGWLREIYFIDSVDLSDTLVPHNTDGEVLGFALHDVGTVLDMIANDTVAPEAALVIAASLARKGLLDARVLQPLRTPIAALARAGAWNAWLN